MWYSKLLFKSRFIIRDFSQLFNQLTVFSWVFRIHDYTFYRRFPKYLFTKLWDKNFEMFHACTVKHHFTKYQNLINIQHVRILVPEYCFYWSLSWFLESCTLLWKDFLTLTKTLTILQIWMQSIQKCTWTLNLACIVI